MTFERLPEPRAIPARSMENVMIARLIALAFALVLPAVTLAQPRIDYGQHVHVRLNHSTEHVGGRPVGKTRFEVHATLLDAGPGELALVARQGRRELASFGCEVQRRGPTRCQSAWLDARAIDRGAAWS